MIAVLRRLSSLKLTLVGMLLLAAGAGLSYGNPASTPVWVLVVPMALLAVNLLAAIISNSRINRRPGLLVFHIGLLGVVVLAAVGRLTHFEAHVELLQGTALSSAEVFDRREGPFHPDGLQDINFVQGAYTVEYFPGIIRGATRSTVILSGDEGGRQTRVIGDDTPLVLDGYRFYTTFNKGFAPVVTWIPDQGEQQTGAVHMPSYPLFDFRQDNTWTPPSGPEIKVWLSLDTGLDENGYWILDGSQAHSTLVLDVGDVRAELSVGESLRVDGGVVRYERLSTWMGYKIFFDPTLHWLFVVSMVGVCGLGAHFWRRFGSQFGENPVGDRQSARSLEGRAA